MTSNANGVNPSQVKAARALLGWSQQDLAARAKVSASTVVEFERSGILAVPDHRDSMRAALETNGVSFAPSGAVIGPELVGAQSKFLKRSAPLRLINVTDLEQWADRLDSKAVFPQLISRLILATTGNRVAQLRFPSDESVLRDDWDGVCEQHFATEVPWLPVGISGWELTTQRQHISSKANEDYEKRSCRPRGFELADSTYVFVSLRSWNQGFQWAREKTAEGKWKCVKALDANDLVQWIELYPAVGYWLASYLDKLPCGLAPLEDIWKEWRQATKCPLSGEVVLAGRDAEAMDILKWLRAAPTVRTVQADSPDEAIAFLYAAIDMLPEPHREFNMMRCLRVFSSEEARRLAESASPLVIVTEDSEPGLAERLAEKGHHVYVAFGSSIGIREADTILPTAPFEDFQAALCNIGIPEVEAERLCRDTFRNVVVLRRLIPSATFIPPKWAQEPESSLLLPCLLAGGWDTDTPGDLKALRILSGDRYEDVARSLSRFTGAPDSPLRRAGSTWKVAAPTDVWFRLAKLISKDDLERFSGVAVSVLGAADPRFEMGADERWLAQIRGKLREHSPWLLSGLSETLLLIAMWGDAARTLPSASAYAGQIVSSLLSDADEGRWYALSDQLRTLAEAAPKEFLDALEDNLKKDESPVLSLFAEDGGPALGRANHADLLWALEVLAWDTKYLSRAALVLAILDNRDPGGRWVNRPKNSLRNIFLLWKPQTHATLAQRLKVLDLLRREESAAAWRLMLRLLPRGHESMSPNAKPRWRDSVGSADETVTYSLIAEGVSAISQRLIDDAGEAVDRWVELIQAFSYLPESARSCLLSRLACLPCEFERDEDRIPIWAALRRFLADHRSFPDEGPWAVSAEVLDRLEALYDQFRPNDAVNQRAWLFSGHPPLIKRFRGNDWEGRDREILALQQKALSELTAVSGLSFLSKLIEKAESPSTVGFALALNADGISDLDPCLFSSLSDLTPAVQDFTAGLVGGLLRRFGVDWRTSILRKAREEDWPEDKVVTLLLRLPTSPDVWQVADSFGDRVRIDYWRAVRVWAPDEDEDMIYACRQLLAVSRARACVYLVAGSRRKLPAQLVIEMLAQAASQPDNNPSGNEAAMFGWSVSQLLRQLESDTEVQASEVAKLEWLHYDLLDHARHTPRVLHSLMSNHPEFFVEVLSAIVPPQSRVGPDEETITEGQRVFRAHAFKLMESWSTVPGLENGILNGAVLRRWVEQAHTLAIKADRVEVGDTYIGRILSFCPEDEDRVWPPVAVRQLIEDLRNPTIEAGIVNGLHDKRGVTIRLPRDGGSLERGEALQYRKWAEAIELEWPRTAALLERVATSLDEYAQHQDDMAERIQWAY